MTGNSQPRFYSRRSAGILILVGVLAGVTVGGGVGVIAASSTKTVTVCANKKTNVLRYAKNGKCVTKTETKVSLNQTVDVLGAPGAVGAKGDAGAVGAKGDAGAAGAKGTDGTAGTKGDTGATGTSGALTNSQIKNICGVNGTTACEIGLTGPGGGIVFMTPSTLGNMTGLFYEAAPSTWYSPSGDPPSTWCDYTNALAGVASPPAGTGEMDGAAKASVMVGLCTSGAANLADSYSSTVRTVVYGDWILPSKGELNQIYVKRDAIGDLDLLNGYWSSSEANSTLAWQQGFGDGHQGATSKSAEYLVRPVRAF